MRDSDEIQNWLEQLVFATEGSTNSNAKTIHTLSLVCQRLRADLQYYATAEKLMITHPARQVGAVKVKLEKAEHGARAKEALRYWPEQSTSKEVYYEG